jgi:hypothetical protein
MPHVLPVYCELLPLLLYILCTCTTARKYEKKTGQSGISFEIPFHPRPIDWCPAPGMTPDLSQSLSPSPSPFAGGTSGATPFNPGHFIAPPSPVCPRCLVKSSPRPPPLLRGRGQGRGPLLSMSPSVLSKGKCLQWSMSNTSTKTI